MKTLTAKILTAYFVQTYDPVTDDIIDYPVWEFENGLILVPGESTADWFFRSSDEIEGCGGDLYQRVEDTGETIDFTAKELAQAWGSSLAEFPYCDDDDCTDLVKELVFAKKQ